MALSFPSAVKNRLQAQGGGAPVALLEVATTNGNYFYWSDSDITAPGALPVQVTVLHPGHPSTVAWAPPLSVAFTPWLTDAGPFKSYANTTTSTGSVTVQNLSGDTVRRDVSQIFSLNMMLGALVYFRTLLADAQYPTFSFFGTVSDVELEADGQGMTLQFESLAAWAKLDAPYQEIGVSCPLSFGSVECSPSTPLTPCNNNYGTCSSIERYKGVMLEWLGAQLSTTQYVQPAPLVVANGKVAG